MAPKSKRADRTDEKPADLKLKSDLPEAPKLDTPSLTDESIRHSYSIGRGEQGVLTFEPYKSALLPHWRFATPDTARTSSQTLAACFYFYVQAGDFVGADMARKFLQMGMTRAARYANHAGGRKYDVVKGKKVEKERGQMDEKMRVKREASNVFREVWLVVKEDQAYRRLKEEWMGEVKNAGKGIKRSSGDAGAEGHAVKKVKTER